MSLSALADRYRLAAAFCDWAERAGGRDLAIRTAEDMVAKDPSNDLDFVVMSVLHGQIEDLRNSSLVRGLECLRQDLPESLSSGQEDEEAF